MEGGVGGQGGDLRHLHGFAAGKDQLDVGVLPVGFKEGVLRLPEGGRANGGVDRFPVNGKTAVGQGGQVQVC